MTTQTAEAFFYAHAGVSYNPATETPEQGRLTTARHLAAAEAWAEESGLEVRWGDDWEIQDHVAEYDGYDHEPDTCEFAELVDGNGQVLESLGCIDDATDDYRRVVAAELAWGAMPRISRVYRDMPAPGTVYERGTVPPYTVGMWYAYCPDHGRTPGGMGGWFRNPETAQKIADRHNATEHP